MTPWGVVLDHRRLTCRIYEEKSFKGVNGRTDRGRRTGRNHNNLFGVFGSGELKKTENPRRKSSPFTFSNEEQNNEYANGTDTGTNDSSNYARGYVVAGTFLVSLCITCKMQCLTAIKTGCVYSDEV